MLWYYHESVTLEEFITLILKKTNKTEKKITKGYILVVDPEVYYSYKLKLCETLTPRLIHEIDKFQLVLIEQWQDLYDWFANLLSSSQGTKDEIIVALYGVFTHFVEVGHDYIPNRFLPNPGLYSAKELNKFLHGLFISQQNWGFEVVINESVPGVVSNEYEEDPLLWKISIPKISKSSSHVSGNQRRLTNLEMEDKQSEGDYISLRTIFMKWVEKVNQDAYTNQVV